MKSYVFNELGYFTEGTCLKLHEKLEGKTYMRFHITWSNLAGNCVLIVETNYKDTAKHIKQFFLACALTILAR